MDKAAPGVHASVAARLNRLPVLGVHRLAVVIVGFGLFFDLYEVFLASTLGTVFRHDFGMSAGVLKAVLSSAFVGQFVGAIVLGRLADRIGRRRAYLINLGIYSVFSVLAAMSPDGPWLVAMRFVAGIGLGAELALADAYLSDLLPAAVRGRYIAAAYTVGFVGVPAAGFLARWLVPSHPLGMAGWRWMFLLGGLGAFGVWIARRALPESPRWLESVGRTAEAERAVAAWEDRAAKRGLPLPPPQGEQQPVARDTLPVRALFGKTYRSRTIMVWVLNALEVFGYYGFGTVAPLVLASKGYSVLGSLGYLAVTYLGYPIGSALSLPIIERMERKTLIAASAVGIAATGLLFGYAGSPAQVIVWGFLYTVASNVFSNAFHVYLGELYPTALRATAAGSAYSISRLVTAALPYVLLPVLDAHGSGAVFTVVAVAMGLLVVDVLGLGPRTTGKALEAAESGGRAR
jgi:putative MFS transporter